MGLTAEPLHLLRQRTSAKWSTYPADVLPLFVAEMDFALAEPIADTLYEAIRTSDTGYQAPTRALPEAFCGFAERRWGWQVDADQVHTTTDVGVAIVEVLRRIIEPGDEVIITPPVYAPFFELVMEAGGRSREIGLLADVGGWRLDLEAIEAAFLDGARVMLLCNPHNPLGHPHAREQLERLAELAYQHGAMVVSDEIHGPLAHTDGEFSPFLGVSAAARAVGIALLSASKAWNLAGLKCALMVTADERMNRIVTGMHEEVFFRTGIFGARASTAAFTHGEPWLDAALETIRENRNLLGDLLREQLPLVRYQPPAASYLAWLDFSEYAWGADPATVILEQARVALNSGPSFGVEGAGFARLNFACSPDVLREAVGRIAAIG